MLPVRRLGSGETKQSEEPLTLGGRMVERRVKWTASGRTGGGVTLIIKNPGFFTEIAELFRRFSVWLYGAVSSNHKFRPCSRVQELSNDKIE